MLTGKTMQEVGLETFNGDLLGDDPKAAFKGIVAKACDAAKSLPDDPNKMIHFSYGDYPMNEGLWHVISFRGLRAYDIAKVINVSTKLPDDLVQAMWDAFVPRAQLWREMGVFGPEQAVPESASLQDRLLGLTGRHPGHDA